MPDKIRRVDYSPDEFLAGVNGMPVSEIGLYWVACSLIYSRNEPIADNAAWIARAAGCTPEFARKLLDRLIERGKLKRNAEGKLENSRATKELGKANKRVADARSAGLRGVEARAEAKYNDSRSRPGGVQTVYKPPGRSRVSRSFKDLREPRGTEPSTFHKNQTLSEKESVSARAREPSQALDRARDTVSAPKKEPAFAKQLAELAKKHREGQS